MSIHHIYFKSQYYKKDRDGAWNTIDSIDREIEQKLRLDYALKYSAYKKYLKRKKQIGLKDIKYELRKAKYKLKKYDNSDRHSSVNL